MSLEMDGNEISAGVRTVTHLASYFDELKRTADGLAVEVAAHTRGYFTPREEENTRAILVSYWKSRNALFELILTIRARSAKEDRDYLESFCIAFAAALVLVDAARYLRELASGRPTIQRKLNEPAPQFGIPANVYDSIQRSLLSARHGWHLYHAVQYYEENADAIGSLGQEKPLFRPLCQIIARLKLQLDVSAGRFLRAKVRTRGSQITRRLAVRLVGRALYGLQKLAGQLVSDRYVRPGHQPRVPEGIGSEIQRQLLPGDVLVVRKEYALTNYFLPGYWPHAALCLGAPHSLDGIETPKHLHLMETVKRLCRGPSDGVPIVLESMKDGVHLRSLASALASDSVVVLRPQLSPALIRQGIARCLSHEGKPYDFDFDFRRSDRLVCTEVVYRAFDGLGDLELPLITRAGRPTLSGSDLIKMAIAHQRFSPVLAYVPADSPQVITGAKAREALARRQGEE